MVLGIIPARFASTRLPGKILEDIRGVPMIIRVLRQVQKAKLLDDVIVAADDDRIIQTVTAYGAKAVMTPSDCASGTDRIALAAKNLPAKIIVNIQGDEPFINPEIIDRGIQFFQSDVNTNMITLACKITDSQRLYNPNIVKVVIDNQQRALYFSRSPIPFCRECEDVASWIQLGKYYQHIGLYIYRAPFLQQFTTWKKTPLESIENLEQLRALENGIQIRVLEVTEPSLSVDTLEDLEAARELAAQMD